MCLKFWSKENRSVDILCPIKQPLTVYFSVALIFKCVCRVGKYREECVCLDWMWDGATWLGELDMGWSQVDMGWRHMEGGEGLLDMGWSHIFGRGEVGYRMELHVWERRSWIWDGATCLERGNVGYGMKPGFEGGKLDIGLDIG